MKLYILLLIGVASAQSSSCRAYEYAVHDKNDMFPDNKKYCKECAGGYFSTVMNAESCTAHSVMPASCDGNTYKRAATKSNDNECHEITECFLWQYEHEAPDEAKDRVCKRCPADKRAANPNSSLCDIKFECKSTQYLLNGVCEDMTWCVGGQYVVVKGEMTRNRQCAPCPKGHYNPGTINANECDECPPGKYTYLTGQSECSTGTKCGKGKAIHTDAYRSFDTVCLDCHRGYYSNNDTDRWCTKCDEETEYQPSKNASSCQDKDTCTSGQWVFSDGSLISNRVCKP